MVPGRRFAWLAGAPAGWAHAWAQDGLASWRAPASDFPVHRAADGGGHPRRRGLAHATSV